MFYRITDSRVQKRWKSISEFEAPDDAIALERYEEEKARPENQAGLLSLFHVSIRKMEEVIPLKLHASVCPHKWSVVRDGPPPHWNKHCVLCDTTEVMTSEEAFAD